MLNIIKFTSSNVFSNERKHSENNTAECADESAALGNLITNLTLDTEENKTILKQLKKANTPLTQEQEECKTNLDETSRALGEATGCQDSCLIALQNKQNELEKYISFKDRMIDYDILQTKLNETLGLLTRKDIDIKEGLVPQDKRAYRLLTTLTRAPLRDKLLFYSREDKISRTTKRPTELKAPECPCHFLRIPMRLLGRLIWMGQTLSLSLSRTLLRLRHQSPLTVAPPTSLPERTPPTLVPILRRTTRMAVRVPPEMSPGLSTSMAEVAAMSDSMFIEDDEEDVEIGESLDSDSVSEDTKDEGPTAKDEDPTEGDEGLAAGVTPCQGRNAKHDEKGNHNNTLVVFLYGTIDEEVYVSQPPGFVDPDHPKKVYKVVKALYGLHQAPRAWYATLSTFLEKHGYKRGTIDKTLFIKRDKKDIMLVQVYVDDIIFGSTKKSWCDEFEALMKSRFQMSSMGELTFFLGLQVKQNKEGIFISQDKYVAEILKKFDLVSVKTAITPIETKVALTKDEEAVDVDVHLYRSMIGSLMYLTASRPDIMFAVCACSRFQVTPKTSHLNVVKRIFKYLKGKPNLGLWYPRESPFDLEAFSDSDYGGSNLDRKSTTGGCQFLGQRLISWQCKKQTIVATSTTEAEYVAAANCCGQVLWVQNQLLDYRFNFMNTKIHIDNESTICIVKNPVYHSKTKHIEIRQHFIRDCYEKKLISVEKIHTDLNVCDLLTKPFDGPWFNFLVTATAKTLANGTLELHATIDTIAYTITEASIRTKLQLADASGITMLPNNEIFEGMRHMGSKSGGWDQFGSNIATSLICLSTGRFVTPSKTPSKTINASGEEQVEDISPTTLEAATILTKVKKIKSFDKGKRYKRRKSSKEYAGTGLVFEEVKSAFEEVNTGGIKVSAGIEEINTGSLDVNTGIDAVTTDSIRVSVPSPDRGRREGKAPMTEEEETQASRKTKEQILQEEAGLAEAIRLDALEKALEKEEVAKQVHLDSLLAQRMVEEQELIEEQKKRKAQVQFEAQSYTKEDWDTIRAKLEANAELKDSVLGKDLTVEDYGKRMVELVNQKRKHFAEERARAKRNKPMTQTQLRNYTSNFLKNQGTWKLTQLKKLNFEEVKAKFEKLVKQLDTYVPMNFEATKESLKRFGEELQTKTAKKLKFDDEGTQPIEEKDEEDKDNKPTKKIGKRRKQIARKGFHTDLDRDESKEKNDSTSGTNIPINPVPVATKSPSIANYKIIKQGRKGVYQIVRENGTDMVYISFGAMLTDISRDDLTELYRIVMKKHGMNEPEDEFEKVLWEYLKNMFEEPLSTDSIWSLPGQQRIICWRYYDACRVHYLNLESIDVYMLIERKYPLSAEVCKAMLDKKLQGGKPDEDCYKLLKMMEKQAGIRK
ncbi:putative ribonuclease H-like domain-containing protein [Tanacetum coccineum]